MKLPAYDPVRVISALLFVVCLVVFIAWGMHIKNKAAKFDNVAAKLETTEESAEISRETYEAASQSNQDHQYEVQEDRRAVATARAPGANAAAHQRLQERIDEAYARGRCAESRLQRKDCGAELSGAANDE